MNKILSEMQNLEIFLHVFKSWSRKLFNEHIKIKKSSKKTYLDSQIVKNLSKVKKRFVK
jgi:hypothetical protein